MGLQEHGGGRAGIVAQMLALLCGLLSPPGMQKQHYPRRAQNRLGQVARLQGSHSVMVAIKKEVANQ